MRAKRVLFLLLVIVMVLSTIPAAASFDVPEGLYFRILQQDENGNFYVESDGGLCGADQKYPLSISYVCMCYVDEAGNETHLQLSDPNLSFPSFLDTSTLQNDPTFIQVDWAREGDGKVTYTAPNGRTFELSWICRLPDLGFYTTPEVSIPGFITEFDVTDTNDTFYLVARDDWTIDSVYRNAYAVVQLQDFATVTLDPGGKFATIKITGDLQGRNWYVSAMGDIEDPVSDTRYDEYWLSLSINDARPSLKFRRAERDDDRVWYEERNNSLESRWFPAPGYSRVFTFYYVENGVETRLKFSDLSFSGNLAASLANENSDDGIVRVEALGFGRGTISYTAANGKTYSVHPEVGLPEVGYYSTTVPSQSSYLREFTVTDNADTFYLAAESGITIRSAALRNEFADIASCTISPDGSYATIQITGEVDDGRWYEVLVNLADDRGSWSDNIDIKLYDGRPALKFQWIMRDNDQWVEEPGDLRTNWSTSKGYSSQMRFYYVENGVETPLELSQLTADGRVFAVSQLEITNDPTLVRVKALDFGAGTISYTHSDGNTYSLRWNSDLPPVGIYSGTVPSKDNYIVDFNYTDTNNTFYLVARDDWELTGVSLQGDLANIADLHFAPNANNKYAAITVRGDFISGRSYNIRYSAVDNVNGDARPNNGVSITLYDARPGLYFRWAEWDDNNGGWCEEPDNALLNRWSTAPGFNSVAIFYYVEGGVETRLTLDDLFFSKNLSAQQEYNTTGGYIIRVDALDFGTGTISYIHTDGKAYFVRPEITLPNVGFYTAPTPGQSSYLQEFVVTDNDKTFYIAALPGLELSSVWLESDFDQIADCVISPDETYATITVTGIPADRWYRLDGYYTDGSNNWYYSIALRIVNDLSGLYCMEVDSQNGTWVETGGIYTQASLYPGDEVIMKIGYGAPSALQRLPLRDLDVSGPIYAMESSDGCIIVKATGWGQGVISYNDGSTTHSVCFNMELPDWGALYSKPVRSTDNFLNRYFTATEDSKTVYIMPGDGFLFDYVHLSPELDAIADYEISTDRTYVALTIIDDDFASGEYIIEAIGKTIPGYTDWTWGNEYWPIALTNAIKAPAAAVIADIQPSGGQGSGQSTVHLTMTNNFAVNQQVTFLVALFDGDGKMSGLKTVSAVVRAGEAFVQDIDMQLAGAAKLKIMSVDSKFAPMLGELILELQPTPQ